VGQGLIKDQCQQLIFVTDVPIQRRGTGGEVGSEPAHGKTVDSHLIHQVNGSCDDVVSAQGHSTLGAVCTRGMSRSCWDPLLLLIEWRS